MTPCRCYTAFPFPVAHTSTVLHAEAFKKKATTEVFAVIVNICLIAPPPPLPKKYTSNILVFHHTGMPVINDISKKMYNLHLACQSVISQQILRETSITETRLQRGFKTQLITQSAHLTDVNIDQPVHRIHTYYSLIYIIHSF